MSKMSELDLAIKELQAAAQSLITVSNSLTALFSQTAEPTVATDTPSQEEAKSEPPKPVIKLEQVRTILAEKSRDGFTSEVKVLLTRHGATRLSDINPANYTALLADAEGLGK